MDYILYLFRVLYCKRWWILLGTLLFTLAVIYKIRNMQGAYQTQATLYTGVISGYGIEANNMGTNWALAQNAIDNLINIIQSESTLNRVSMRLFARILVSGDPDKDQNGITAASYKYTYNHMKNSAHGKELIALIDRNSEDKTMENFIRYQKPTEDNYIYGVFHYQHPFCSYGVLKGIQVSRLGSSDLLNITYSAGDPGICYNTIEILMKEFVNEYSALRYGETNKVIEYFRTELDRIGKELNQYEDDLTRYNVDNRIINYYDETKEIAAINKEFELREQDVLFSYNSSKAMLEELERQMDKNAKQAITNIDIIDKLKQASVLTGKITEMETFPNSNADSQRQLKQYKSELSQLRRDLSTITNQHVDEKYTKSGLARKSIVEQWLDQTLLYEKAKAELDIVKQSRQELNEKYVFYAPVGTTIKRKERIINFSEQSYLTTLTSYNEALMRKKNLEMTAAALKVLNPPTYPLTPDSIHRKKIAMIACIISFLLLTVFFLLLEFLDRTLRNSVRTRRLTGCPILGEFPHDKPSNPYNKIYNNAATRYLSNQIFHFFTNGKRHKPYVLSVLSMNVDSGKEYIMNQLEEYWKNLGLTPRILSAGVDFNADSSRFLTATNVDELYTPGKEDILIVDYPAMNTVNIPISLLRNAHLNLVVIPADYGWKTSDKILLHRIESELGSKPYICLSNAPRYDLENFMGMLPPYTLFRKLGYRLSQLLLTGRLIQRNSKNKLQGNPTISTAKDKDDE